MKQRVFSLVLLCLLFLLTLSTPSEAIWWLFGRQEMPPQVSNIYIGSARGIDIDDQLFITSDQLVDGKLVIRGTAYSQKSPIVKVMVSLDHGETWDAATIAKPGNRVSFIYEFEPKSGLEYEIVFQAFDLQGMESEVWDSGYYSVAISRLSFEQILSGILEDMASTYSRTDIRGFMKHVSIDFDGGQDILENALSSDFNTYVDTSLKFSIDAVNPGKTGYEVIVDWTQYLVERGGGKRIERNGLSSFYFTSAYTLIAMKGDVPFGFTSKRINEQSGLGYTPQVGVSGRAKLVSVNGIFQAFRFITEEVVRYLTWESMHDYDYDLLNEGGFMLCAPAGIVRIEGLSFDEVTEPPISGYEYCTVVDPGDVVVVICGGNTWAVVEIEDINVVENEIDNDDEWPTFEVITTVIFKYRYHDTEIDIDSLEWNYY